MRAVAGAVTKRQCPAKHTGVQHIVIVHTAGKFALLWLFVATTAAAQTAPAPSSVPALAPAWTVAAGYESFWLRDAAGAGPPQDGSPIAWEGAGPTVTVFYERGVPGRLHHFEGSFVSSGGFSLESPVRSTPAPSNDHASRVGGRYEYRRYPFRDLWMSGFDIGFGIEGDVEHLSFSRHFAPAIVLDTGVTNVGTAGVVAARLHRWQRLDAQVAWGNGLSIGSGSSRHRAGTETRIDQWGGGYQTHLHIRAGVRVASRASVLLSYLVSGEGRYANHETSAFGRSRFAMGVSYEP